MFAVLAKQKPPSTPRQKLTDRCTHHEGKTIELFCGDHDELCCSVCVAVGHRACKDVVYIPQAAAGVESSMELLEVCWNFWLTYDIHIFDFWFFFLFEVLI
jgi:hypothetical protein